MVGTIKHNQTRDVQGRLGESVVVEVLGALASYIGAEDGA